MADTDYYGRPAPKPGKGHASLPLYTNATSIIVQAMQKIYDRCIDPQLTIRKVTVMAYDLKDETDDQQAELFEQTGLFDEPQEKDLLTREQLQKEHQLQDTINLINKTYGKNSVYKGVNRRKAATGLERNKQVGGHKG